MPFLPRRLYARIILLVSCILLATGATFGWMNARHQTKSLLTAMRANAAIMVRNFAASSAHYLLIQDYAGLETFLAKSLELPDIIRLQVCEPNGALVGDVVRLPNGTPQAKTSRARLSPPPSRITSIVSDKDQLVVWHPIEAGSLLGWIRVDFSLSSIHVAQSRIWGYTLLLAMVWVACSAFLASLVLRSHVRSISRLTAFARQLDEHKGAQISLGDQPLEIAELGASLNEASANLLLTEQQLLAEKERLRHEKALLRCIIDSADDLIFVKDREGSYIGCNKASEAFVGLSEQAQIGKSDFDFFDRDMAERIRADDRRVIEEGRAFHGEERVTYPDGRVVLLDTLKVPFYGQNREALGLVGISRDIT